MKRIWIGSLVLGFFLPLLHGDTASGTFARGNKHYQEGRIGEALAVYQGLSRGMVNWKILFNIGNCHYQQRDYLKAKIFYLRAQKLNPLEATVERNLSIVNRRLHLPMTEKPDFLARLWLRLSVLFNPDRLSWLILLAVLLVNAFLVILLLKGRRRSAIYGLGFSLFLLVLLVGYRVVRDNETADNDVAVIIRENATLRSGPGENNTILFKVPAGIEVRIIERSREWCQISAASQAAGWIEAEYLETI